MYMIYKIEYKYSLQLKKKYCLSTQTDGKIYVNSDKQTS